MNALRECHSQLARLIGSSAEPLEVLQRAEEHRAYWRPKRVRFLLLAESHVYTTPSELEHSVVLNDRTDIPRGFVRLVYCLGYGENRLLNRPIVAPLNSGTPQFWKIFYSCVNLVYSNGDFAPILGSTPFQKRIENKLALLQRLKDMGVWLLDASLAALYPKPSPWIVEACVRTSWDSYVGQVIRSATPSHIVCIGKGVGRTLADRLFGLGIPVTVVPQPNARLSSKEHIEVFRRYYDIVSCSAKGQASVQVGPSAVPRRITVSSPTPMGNKHAEEEVMSESSLVIQRVAEVPTEARVRRWTLREDNCSHHHGVVYLSDSPLHLRLSWRPDAAGHVTLVGLFRLDLHRLLDGAYIRREPRDSSGSALRLRVVKAGGVFYIQARDDSPRIQLR